MPISLSQRGKEISTRRKGLRRDTLYLLLSKGVTAERFTGVAPDPNQVIDGLILAYLPAGTKLEGTLAEFCGDAWQLEGKLANFAMRYEE